MADKPRKTGRPAGARAGAERGARPGERPQPGGRRAGKPERGPAAPRKVAGVDLDALDKLQNEGLLSAEGRRLLQGAGGGGRTGAPERRPRLEHGPAASPENRPVRPGRGAAFGVAPDAFESVDEQLARSLTRGPRRFGGAARPERVERARPEREERARPEREERSRPERGERARGERPGGERPERRPLQRPAARGPRRLNVAEAEVAERLQKVMARAGVASRRHSEELIQAGRVTVNGKVVTELGTKVLAGQDRVEIDGRPLGKEEGKVYLLLNKPKGYVTTLYDPQGRPKVTDLLGDEIGARIYPVGRLDYDTEGLLLLTNDGELANALMHPAKQVRKTYIAKVRGVPGPAKLRALETGVELEDGVTAPAEVKMIDVKAPNAATVSIRIHEGRNRQVRRMFEAVGHEVIHLKRTTLGPLHLKDLPVSQWRALSEQEVKDLYTVAGLRWGGKNAPKRKER